MFIKYRLDIIIESELTHHDMVQIKKIKGLKTCGSSQLDLKIPKSEYYFYATSLSLHAFKKVRVKLSAIVSFYCIIEKIIIHDDGHIIYVPKSSLDTRQ